MVSIFEFLDKYVDSDNHEEVAKFYPEITIENSESYIKQITDIFNKSPENLKYIFYAVNIANHIYKVTLSHNTNKDIKKSTLTFDVKRDLLFISVNYFSYDYHIRRAFTELFMLLSEELLDYPDINIIELLTTLIYSDNIQTILSALECLTFVLSKYHIESIQQIFIRVFQILELYSDNCDLINQVITLLKETIDNLLSLDREVLLKILTFLINHLNHQKLKPSIYLFFSEVISNDITVFLSVFDTIKVFIIPDLVNNEEEVVLPLLYLWDEFFSYMMPEVDVSSVFDIVSNHINNYIMNREDNSINSLSEWNMKNASISIYRTVASKFMKHVKNYLNELLQLYNGKHGNEDEFSLISYLVLCSNCNNLERNEVFVILQRLRSMLHSLDRRELNYGLLSYLNIMESCKEFVDIYYQDIQLLLPHLLDSELGDHVSKMLYLLSQNKNFNCYENFLNIIISNIPYSNTNLLPTYFNNLDFIWFRRIKEFALVTRDFIIDFLESNFTDIEPELIKTLIRQISYINIYFNKDSIIPADFDRVFPILEASLQRTNISFIAMTSYVFYNKEKVLNIVNHIVDIMNKSSDFPKLKIIACHILLSENCTNNLDEHIISLMVNVFCSDQYDKTIFADGLDAIESLITNEHPLIHNFIPKIFKHIMDKYIYDLDYIIGYYEKDFVTILSSLISFLTNIIDSNKYTTTLSSTFEEISSILRSRPALLKLDFVQKFTQKLESSNNN